MAHVEDLKVPYSKKSSINFALGKHIRLTIDICGRYGHVWNWHEKVPAAIDKERSYFKDKLVPIYFEAPFRPGFAWACERENCGHWLSVSQSDSARNIPTPHQDEGVLGTFGKYYFDKDSPFSPLSSKTHF